MAHTTTCPTCQQPLPSQPRQSTDIASTPSEDGEIQFICQETCRLDELISRLNKERVALLERLNRIRPPTKKLPTEILSSIFDLACPPPDLSIRHTFPSYTKDGTLKLPPYQYSHLTLAAVSSQWRQVVWSNPRLWTWITLHLTTEKNTERAAKFLCLFLQNSSSNSPFSLALHFPRGAGTRSSSPIHHSINNLLIGALPRITELHVMNPPSHWHDHTRLLSHISDYSLGYELDEGSNPPVAQVMLPFETPLRQLSLQGVIWRSSADIQVPWTTITSLNLLSISPDRSVQILVECTNLIDFRCRSISSDLREPLPGPVTLSHLVVLPFLETFRWETYDHPWSRALIQHLHVPALTELRWNTFNDRAFSDTHIRAFFNRLPSTLDTIVLSYSTSHLQYIRDDSAIIQLWLYSCTTRDIRTLIRKLTPSPQGPGGAAKPLPQLRGVMIGDVLRDERTGNEVKRLNMAPMITMLEKRLDESTNTFVFATTNFDPVWAPEDYLRQLDLIEQGYSVGVHERVKFDDDFWS